MKYKIRKFDINMDNDPFELQHFLNNLKGEVVSIIPNLARTTLSQIYGASRKIDFLVVVEKII